MKELEVSKTVVVPPTSPAGTRTEPVFDMSKHVKVAPSFSEAEVDKYFLHNFREGSSKFKVA